MMKTNGENMGRIVQRAVESEFQEKGYSRTKMLAIVRRAGVACLMLHYYYKVRKYFKRSCCGKRVGQSLLPGMLLQSGNFGNYL